MSDLFLWSPTSVGGSTRLFWPDPDPDPGHSDPIMLDADMDRWNGDEVMDLGEPWLLMTAAAWEAVDGARITGLHVIPMPTLRYSDSGAIRARYGEFARRELPPFLVARIKRTVRVANDYGDEQRWSQGDRLRFWDWAGDDFTLCGLGPVVTDRARSVLLGLGILPSSLKALEPKEGLTER